MIGAIYNSLVFEKERTKYLAHTGKGIILTKLKKKNISLSTYDELCGIYKLLYYINIVICSSYK